jgi:lipoate-protein ligase B
MNQLEEIVIRALEAFGLVSGRRQGMPGVWIEDRKIAAMGVRISRGVTRHGFALNVVNDLAPFSAIVPCGLSGLGVTSISRELGAPVGLDRAMKAVVEAVQDVFGFALLEARV